ncbi:MAG: nuclear transport factor 2 family protein [Solirubrobacteraceae bacterium]
MPERARDVEEVVRTWLDAKQAADPQGIARRLSAYKGVLAIGTEAGEWWPGVDAFADAHTGGGPFSGTVNTVEAHRHGPVAWAAVDATIETDEPDGVSVRLTLVLVEELDGWRIVQSHASTPD